MAWYPQRLQYVPMKLKVSRTFTLQEEVIRLAPNSPLTTAGSQNFAGKIGQSRALAPCQRDVPAVGPTLETVYCKG